MLQEGEDEYLPTIEEDGKLHISKAEDAEEGGGRGGGEAEQEGAKQAREEGAEEEGEEEARGEERERGCGSAGGREAGSFDAADSRFECSVPFTRRTGGGAEGEALQGLADGDRGELRGSV